MMNKNIVLMLLFTGAIFAQSANIVNDSGSTKDVYASSAYKVYADTFGVNPDLSLRLCGVGQKFVAAVYSASLGGGNYEYIAISWNLTTGSDKTMVYTTNNMGGGCYQTPVDAYAFSQFRDTSRTPPVYVSAFPGRIHALYSDNSDGSSPSFVGVGTANGWLRGSYAVTRAFDHTLNLVNATVTSITFETDVGSISRSPSDAEWGLSAATGRSMLVALCTDTIGDTCSDAFIANSTSQFPVQLTLGAVPINDQNVYNRNIVVNGLGYPLCIGADLSTAISANPDSMYYGETTNITVTVTNSGNVNVTTAFELALNITGPGGYVNNTLWTITEDLLPGQSTVRSINWTANGPAGVYTATGRADQTWVIAECSKTNNNASTTITSAPYYILNVTIDGNETNNFRYWGRPYNVTLTLTDSDGNPVPDTRFVLTETNGLNLFAPTQTWATGGLKSESRGTAVGDAAGQINIAVIPTCNELYTTHPSSAEIISKTGGNYSMRINAYNNATGAPYILLYNGTLTYDMPLGVWEYTCVDPGWVNNKVIVNSNTYVKDVFNAAYKVYSIFKKLVAP